VSADLDAYVETCLAAKAAGLPIVMGMEVDYYPGRMDKVAALLSGYPFDVLLGSVHWLGAWMFDDLDSAVAMEEWDSRGVDAVWDAYTRAREYMDTVRNTEIVHEMIARQVNWEWAEARLVVDDPAKALDRAKRTDYLLSNLEQLVGPPKRTLHLVSPYLVPTKAGVAAFKKISLLVWYQQQSDFALNRSFHFGRLEA